MVNVDRGSVRSCVITVRGICPVGRAQASKRKAKPKRSMFGSPSSAARCISLQRGSPRRLGQRLRILPPRRRRLKFLRILHQPNLLRLSEPRTIQQQYLRGRGGGSGGKRKAMALHSLYSGNVAIYLSTRAKQQR